MPSLVCHHLSSSWPSGEEVIRDLGVAFPTRRTGLIGRTGVGKSTLIGTLVGAVPPPMRFGGAQGAVSTAAPTAAAVGRRRVSAQWVSRYATTADTNALRAQLARFLLDAATVARPLRTLSGGERFRDRRVDLTTLGASTTLS